MNDPRIDRVEARAFTIPTDGPEADGTLEWDSTTIIVVEARAGGRKGLGYTYGHRAAAVLINATLADIVRGREAMAVAVSFEAMCRHVRNLGRPGLASMAISAVDIALWDLKARLLDQSLASLLGAVRSSIPVYGSGGFTSYPTARLQEQLGGWVDQGIRRVKMKVGSHPAEDADRVAAARQAIGPDAELFVDANGAYDRKQALALGEDFARHDVRWFEEPVSSDDLDGLRLLRNRLPAVMEVAAGEYGSDILYFRRMIEAEAVDVLQPDASRCGGVTGFMRAAALCAAYGLPLSAHTAPSLHAHLCCAAQAARHTEYFHDHVRVEALLFDGAQRAVRGCLRPDPARPGLGLELKEKDAAPFAV